MARPRKQQDHETKSVDQTKKADQHDEQAKESEAAQTQPESSAEKNDYQNHPKFDKFKKGVN